MMEGRSPLAAGATDCGASHLPRPPGAPGTAVGIVALGADSIQLARLIESVSASVNCVYVFVNGLIDADVRNALKTVPIVRLIECDHNLGVGAALNLIALTALLDGHEYLCVFDQDTGVRPGIVEALRAAFASLRDAGVRPAVIAPRLVGATGLRSKAPRYFTRFGQKLIPGLSPVQFVPTSGSLLDLSVLRETGFFRADYFVDGIDLEWCFRAWSMGHSCWVSDNIELEHAVGSGVIEWRPLNLSIPHQAPFRMYCYIRNTIYGMRLPHIPWVWKAKQSVYVCVQAIAYAAHYRFDRLVLRALASGAVDGFRGRLGPPPGAPLAGGNPLWSVETA